MNHRYQKIISKAYDELACYLGKIPWPNESSEKKKARTSFYRSLNKFVKRFNFLLKYLSSIGLIVFLAFFLISMISPVACADYLGLFQLIFIVSILTKIFSPLVDLETRYIQYVVLLIITLFFVVADQSAVIPPVSIALFFVIFITVSRYAKRQMKLAMLDMMFADPDFFQDILADKQRELTAKLEPLNVRSFDMPHYRRHFSVARSRKKRVVETLPAPLKDQPLPPKDTFRVQIWPRDPLWDLSSIREFMVCSFLGGSQDASAFDFMMSKTLTMLDMVSHRGRVIRALLMSSTSIEHGRVVPILVVNAVFGRDGGLVGSVNDDNLFIKEQIEAYARYCGFGKVIYSTSPTNKRPRLFVEYLNKFFACESIKMKCRLVDTKEPIKLEIFNRLEPGGNLYFMLFFEMMNLTDSYAMSGMVKGYGVDIRNRFLECPPDLCEIPTSNLKNILCKTHTLSIDSRLWGETAETLLTGFLTVLPELSTSGIPKTITVAFKPNIRQLVTGA